jgi:hypothetical protein
VCKSIPNVIPEQCGHGSPAVLVVDDAKLLSDLW